MTFTTLIDAAGLGELLRQHPRRLVLLDCRFDLGKPDAGRHAYLDGHIPQARYADLNRHLAGPITAHSGRHPLPPRHRLREFLASLGVNADTQVVAYDEANGSFAARAWWLLRWLGHHKVAVLDGGHRAWVAAGGAIETGPDEGNPLGQPAASAESGGAPPGPPPAAGAVAHPAFPRSDEAGETQSVTTLEVALALEDSRRILVDARAPERFAGDVEPIDPVVGHIPGAVNHPFNRNLDAGNHFLSPAELERRWLDTLNGKDPRDAILMCGSGVTACHNALALEIAGLSGAKLYPGSWSEWIRDPERPVARGPARCS